MHSHASPAVTASFEPPPNSKARRDANSNHKRDLRLASTRSPSRNSDGVDRQYGLLGVAHNCVGVLSGQIQLTDIPCTECSFTAVRTVGWAHYQRRQKADANPSKWALCTTLISRLSGLLPGVSSVFLLADNLVAQTFITLASAVSVPLHCSHFPTTSLPPQPMFFQLGHLRRGSQSGSMAASLKRGPCHIY